MATKLTSKGQVTVPKGIREHLGIGPGSSVQFHVEDGRVYLVPRQGETVTLPWTHIVGHAARANGGDPLMTADEVMRETRGWD